MSNLHRKRTLLINTRVLDYYVDNKHLIDKSQLSHLRAIQEKLKGLNEYETHYRYLTDKKDKDCSIARLGYGRIYGEVGSPEYLDYNYRNNLFADYYWDIDIKNCHPTLLTQYAKNKYNMELKQLTHYVNNREICIEEIIEYYKENYNETLTRNDVKDRMIALLYGAKIGPLKSISDEISNLSTLVKEDHDTLWNTVSRLKSSSTDNRKGTFMSFIAQTEEVKVLSAIDSYFLFLQRSIDSLAYDGCMLRKLEGETQEQVEDMLPDIQKYVKEKTGYDITLVIKPMERDIDDSLLESKEEKTDKKYKELKDKFEEKHFFLKTTATICEIEDNDDLTQYNIKNAPIVFAEWELPDKKKLVTKWLNDGNKRIYTRLVNNPQRNEAPDEYNIFRDFIGAKAEGRNDAGLARVLLLIKMLVNHDQVGYEYVLNWIALLIQKPWIIPRTCLVFIGDQGVGKDTLWDFIGEKLIGFWANIKDANRDLYGEFATAMKGTFLQKLEEANPASNRANQDKFKGFVTGTKQTINPKGMPSYELDAYPHFVATSNRNPFIVEQTDRRLVYWWCSDEKRGDHSFWIETHKLLADEGTVASAYQFFMEHDITNFISTDIPTTSFKEALRHDEKPSSIMFLEQFDEHEEMKSGVLYTKYQTFCMENDLHGTQVSLSKFSRDITAMTQKGFYTSRQIQGFKHVKRTNKKPEGTDSS